MLRKLNVSLTTLAMFALPLAAQNADPDRNQAGTGTLPAGWSARTDRGQPLTALRFSTMGNGFHVVSGPPAIYYRAADAVTGNFHTEATFTQTKAPQHPEAYGMFYAGQALGGEGVRYVYFIVRGDGRYMIRERTGATTRDIVGWTEHASVTKQDAEGKATNRLEIGATDGKVSFKVNGTEVHSLTVPAGQTNGVIGLRVNHNLDVHIDRFVVHKM